MESLRQHCQQQLLSNEVARQAAPGPRRGVAVGGTATTLLGLHLGHSAYRPASLHGNTLTTRDIGAMATQLLSMTQAERIAWLHFAPDRADTLLAGAIILEEILHHLRLDEVIVSTRGLRFGLLQTEQRTACQP